MVVQIISRKMKKINLQIKLWNNSSFVILIFAILKFRNIDRSTFRRSKFWPSPDVSDNTQLKSAEHYWSLQVLRVVFHWKTWLLRERVIHHHYQTNESMKNNYRSRKLNSKGSLESKSKWKKIKKKNKKRWLAPFLFFKIIINVKS